MIDSDLGSAICWLYQSKEATSSHWGSDSYICKMGIITATSAAALRLKWNDRCQVVSPGACTLQMLRTCCGSSPFLSPVRGWTCDRGARGACPKEPGPGSTLTLRGTLTERVVLTPGGNQNGPQNHLSPQDQGDDRSRSKPHGGSKPHANAKSREWKSLSHVRLLASPWTTQCMKLSRPERWSG